MPKAGIEPARGKAPLDFGSRVSSSSATSARSTRRTSYRQGVARARDSGHNRAPSNGARRCQRREKRIGRRGGVVRRRTILALLVLLIGAFALVAAGCGGDDDGDVAGTEAVEDGEGGGDNEVEELPSAACQPVEYEGDGEPDVLITSDLPMQGSSRTQTVQMVEAIRFILNERGWSAGGLDIGYQVCDDSTAQTGQWDTGKCNSNANEFAQNPDVVGVIGTFNSGCAAIEIPVLNGAPEGGVAIVSPANTYVCLTTVAPACEDTEPDQYYPSGARNYNRIVAHDAYQAAALATLPTSLREAAPSSSAPSRRRPAQRRRSSRTRRTRPRRRRCSSPRSTTPTGAGRASSSRCSPSRRARASSRPSSPSTRTATRTSARSPSTSRRTASRPKR